MTEPVDSAKFYDRMAADYHLISQNWYSAIEIQSQTLDKLLKKEFGEKRPKVLDCSCGIGTQVLGLGLLGYDVTGTDISEGAIRRAREEAKKLDLSLSLQVADMRSLEGIEGPFDAVLSFDNSVAHLVTDADLAFALSSVQFVLRPGGVLFLSLRDYDALLVEKPTGIPPRKFSDQFGDRIYFQTWDWQPDGRSYDLGLHILKRRGEAWESHPTETRVRAYSRAELTAALERTGFSRVEWLSPEQTGHYQQIVRAKKA